jgi:hypothetical protein
VALKDVFTKAKAAFYFNDKDGFTQEDIDKAKADLVAGLDPLPKAENSVKEAEDESILIPKCLLGLTR